MEPALLNVLKTIVQGDDYRAAESRALTWASPSWPNLAGATLEMTVGHDNSNIYGNLPVVWKQTLPGSPETRIATLELNHTQTGELAEGVFDYTLRATLLNEDRLTLSRGRLTVIAKPAEEVLMP